MAVMGMSLLGSWEERVSYMVSFILYQDSRCVGVELGGFVEGSGPGWVEGLVEGAELGSILGPAVANSTSVG